MSRCTILTGLMLLCLILLPGSVQGVTEENMSVKDKRLLLCPDRPNCVSTLDESENHAIAPYRYRQSLEEGKAILKQVFGELPRTMLVKEEEDYLHFEVRSFVFGFVDDVELVLDDVTKSIHFRSAARTGTYDFGVNRRRMEKLRTVLEDKL